MRRAYQPGDGRLVAVTGVSELDVVQTLLELDGSSLTIADAIEVSRRGTRIGALGPRRRRDPREPRPEARADRRGDPDLRRHDRVRRQRPPPGVGRQDVAARDGRDPLHGLRDGTDRRARGRPRDDAAARQLPRQGQLRRPRGARAEPARTAQPRRAAVHSRARFVRRQRRPRAAVVRRPGAERRRRGRGRRGAPRKRATCWPSSASSRSLLEAKEGLALTNGTVVHERLRLPGGRRRPRARRSRRAADRDGLAGAAREPRRTSTRSCSTRQSPTPGWCRAPATSASCWPTHVCRSTARSCSRAG